MTENEAIEIIKLFREDWDRNSKTPNAHALDMAIDAIEENRQYRLIGTVNECQKAMEKQAKKIRKIDTRQSIIGMVHNALNQAADTIEALSAKLAKANVEQSSIYYDGNLIETMVEEIENLYGKGTDLTERARNYLASMDRSEVDYVGGWIVCEDSLPDDREFVLATDGRYVYLVEYDADLDAPFGDMDGIIAWMPLPKPYNPDRS